MKRNLIFALGFLLFFGFVSVNCNAQSSNNEQRIVGTWVDETNGSTTTFNANGTGTGTGEGAITSGTFKYGVAGNKIAVVLSDGRDSVTFVFDFYISSDGKTLILTAPVVEVGPGGNGSLLRKK